MRGFGRAMTIGVSLAAGVAATGSAALTRSEPLTGAATHAAPGPAPDLGQRVARLTRASPWTLAASIPVAFRTHHPQGMVRIGETFFISSVEVTVPPARLPDAAGGYDRSAGEGVGHLFKVDASGGLIADLRMGEGAIYHPGGLDYDGRDLWVPVAEYRPDSRAIVYRVDPDAMRAVEVFRFADHIGAVVRDTDDNTLHGVSWGSRRFYRWTLDGSRRVRNAGVPPRRLQRLNPSHYVDYQDCRYAGGHRMLCTGVAELRTSPSGPPFRLGGMELIDLKDGRPRHQVPVLLWTAGGLDMTHNPVWVEPHGSGLRAWFMPDDNTSTIYVYDVDTSAGN